MAPWFWGAVTLVLAAATARTMRANLVQRGSRLVDRIDDDGWMADVDRRSSR